jgi:mono/diheme cytochrome c family protein
MTISGAYAPRDGASFLSRRRAALVAALATLAVCGVAASASAADADADHGETLAKRWCAACHIVAPDQTHGEDNAPPFASIAKIPGFGADKIARFLMDPHPKMPDMQLSRPESEDLAAYIVSLAK